jgi:hypothetical protein
VNAIGDRETEKASSERFFPGDKSWVFFIFGLQTMRLKKSKTPIKRCSVY